MKARVLLSLGIILVAIIGIAWVSGASGEQAETVVLQPGQGAVCATCVPCVTETPTNTPIPPTNTPTPTVTPVPPTDTPTITVVPPTNTPTPTPQPSAVEFGVVRTANNVWPIAASELRADFVEYRITSSMSDATILAALDYADSLGLKVLLNFYVSGTNTNKPWYLDGDEWRIQQRGIEVLQLVENHPALWGVYQLHEPYDSSKYHADSDAQRALYALLKSYADVPLYTDIASIARAEQAGEILSDGMCDLCCVFPTHWPDDPTDRINAEVATWRRTMSGSQLVIMVNVYDAGANYVMPTAQQIRDVRAHLCGLGLPYLYYPWNHGSYSRELKDVPELWPVIAEGCGGEPPPTNTPAPATPTDTPQPSDTPMPPPTSTPGAGGALIIDHAAYADDLETAQLDAARALVSYFTHKSIGNNILDGMADLIAQDPERYTIAIRYSNGTQAGLNQYQVGRNGDPQSKISGFASTVKDGHQAAFMKFCVGDWQPFSGHSPIDVWPQYRNAMAGRPNGVWWTLPLTRESDGRGLAGFAEFNAAVRRYVAENGGVLFDLADIESDGGRCQRNGIEALCNEWTSDGAHLNTAGRQRVASALWVLLAIER